MACPIAIRRLQLTDFRNYAALDLALPAAPVVLVGQNGAGKTNLLEAVSFLSPGRGLRRADYGEVARAGGAGGWAVAVEADAALGPVAIGTGLMRGPDGLVERQRRIRLNHAPARNADQLLDHLRIIWLTPAMDGLFAGPAGDRRRFLDRLVLALDPEHGRRVSAYERALTSRNRLLEESPGETVWLDGIEGQIAELGVAVAAARRDLVGRLAGLVAEIGEGPFPHGLIRLDGWIEDCLDEVFALDAEDRFRVELRDTRRRDQAARRTLTGPHRSDLEVVHGPKAMPAAQCSTGEQKALLVGITLAHARLVAAVTGIEPILLLDEIAAHLDQARRAALFDILAEMNVQAFLTGTDRAYFAALEGRAGLFLVADAAVGPAPEF